MESLQLKSSIADLFFEAGINSVGMEITPIYGGGNNKVVSVQAGDKKYLVKFYYSHSSDKRDRLATEYSFLSYAISIGLDCVPKPIFCDRENNLGLYEFVEGKKLDSSELKREHILQAASFIKMLNAKSTRDQTLPTASEGCFSLESHFSIIDKRLNSLLCLPTEGALDHQALSFVLEIKDAWVNLKSEVSAFSKELNIDDRCISPSDFGFHNALLKETGDICFIDFEYAGWDDPAKMVGDFFLQPAVLVSFEHFDDFISEALSYSPNKAGLAERTRLLFPIFKIKWCCLMLNEFLPDAANRRQFANPTLDPEHSKRLQLEKAQQFFHSRKV